ncbi:MAG: ATP-binding protein [Kyrpidia sp.]|nr:ATP-binding protein [Kyrpidia sp.]
MSLCCSLHKAKTHLAAAIAISLLEKKKSVVFGTVTPFLGQIRKTFDDDREHEWDVMRRFSWCDLLIIDDLGKEKVSDWVQQTVYEIINNRYVNNKSLVITTNMSLGDIRERYQEHGDAIVSRILEMCRGVRLDGPDWRKKRVLGNA